MNMWLTADWHLGEGRFDLMQRPFKTILEHNKTIIDRHNEVVKKDDLVYVVGDVVYQKAAEPDLVMRWLNHMNGRKILIRGNHDRVFSDEQFAPYFESVIPDGEGLELEIEGIPCYITHYPTQGRADRFNLVGHIHGAFKFQLNMLNVGVDVHHFRPVNFKEIPFYLRAITEFYDNDVWIAYNEINSRYIDSRGKRSAYFQKG